MLEARDHPPLDYSDGEPADRAVWSCAMVLLGAALFGGCG
jgi:hypothetical protein